MRGVREIAGGLAGLGPTVAMVLARIVLAPIVLALIVPAPAGAEPAYPNKPVRVLVPYGPGGVAERDWVFGKTALELYPSLKG